MCFPGVLSSCIGFSWVRQRDQAVSVCWVNLNSTDRGPVFWLLLFFKLPLLFLSLFIEVTSLSPLQIYVIDSADRKRFEETGQVNDSYIELFPKTSGIH